MIYDVAIIGGGVVGGLIARELAKYRLNICILEKEDDIAMGATRANSAIVHGGFDPVPGTLKLAVYDPASIGAEPPGENATVDEPNLGMPTLYETGVPSYVLPVTVG